MIFLYKKNSQWILDRQNEANRENYIQKNLYGFGSIQEHEGKQYFSNWVNFEQSHSLPISINIMFEALLRSILPEKYHSTSSITVQSAPFLVDSKITSPNEVHEMRFFISWAMTCLILFPFAFPVLVVPYILNPIKEQTSKSKLLQLMTGTSPMTFWLANYTFDLMVHLIAILTMFLFIGLFHFDANLLVPGEYQ